jgi:O-antigen/teichoic acid export membrane protein
VPLGFDERLAGGGKRPTASRGGVRSLVFRVLAAGTDFLVVLVTARAFGATGRGLYALAAFAASLALTALGGAAQALAAEHAHGRTPLSRLYAASATLAAAGGGVIALAIGVFVAATWPSYRVLLFAAIALPFLLCVEYQLAVNQAEGNVRRMHWLHLSRSAVPLAAIAGVAFAASGRIYVALAAWTVARVVVALVALALERRRVGLDWHGASALARRFARRGAPVSLGNGIARLNYRIDLIVVAALLPLAQVGLYSVAIAIGEVLWLLSRAVTTGAYATIVGHRDERRAVETTLRAFRHSIALLTLASLVLLVSAGFLLGPVFGSDFAKVWTPLALLLPGVIALGTVEVLREFFLVRLERSREYLTMATVGTLVNLGVALLLVPVIGLAGAALSTSVSYLGAAFYIGGRFAHITGARSRSLYIPGLDELRDYRRLGSSFMRGRRLAGLLPR